MIDIEAGIRGLMGLNASLTRGRDDCLEDGRAARESLLCGCEFCRVNSRMGVEVDIFDRKDASAENDASTPGDKAW